MTTNEADEDGFVLVTVQATGVREFQSFTFMGFQCFIMFLC